ncbi:hypothetical protein KOEU_32560 [Komagataeibacter europaeus]|uniref:Uncharacterized protein n=1 Tax=Komagataeibacter europaeus TaxID=33995 RepID=A0A0M0EE63_KOMEU|nr:hypothetical protein KOEU_32560 [Komagataeibacter europaeus]
MRLALRTDYAFRVLIHLARYGQTQKASRSGTSLLSKMYPTTIS